MKSENGTYDENLIIQDEIKELNNLFDKKKTIAIPKTLQNQEKQKEKEPKQVTSTHDRSPNMLALAPNLAK